MDLSVIVAIAIAVATPVATWLIQSRMFEAKTSEWRNSVIDRLDRIEATQAQTDLAAFRAMDTRREIDWIRWREDTDKRIEAERKGQADWRHHEYAPEARKQSTNITMLQEQVMSLKDRVGRIEHRVFNGSSKT